MYGVKGPWPLGWQNFRRLCAGLVGRFWHLEVTAKAKISQHSYLLDVTVLTDKRIWSGGFFDALCSSVDSLAKTWKS